MALTQKEREFRIHINQILDKYSGDIANIFDDVVHVSEGVGGKISNLIDLQRLMNDNKDKLAFLGKNTFQEGCSSPININIFLMSTKNVNVPAEDNLISLGYDLYEYGGEVSNIYVESSGSKSTKLEKFMELPIKPDVEDEISARDLVKRCDAAQFYKLYQEEAVGIIRKLFPYSYTMFTGPKLYKKEEKIGPFGENTLYVTYDKFRKKFKYAYNPEFILESVIEEWMINNNRYNSLKDCYCYLLAFMITHEMLHIVHHNTNSDNVRDDSRLSTADPDVANIVMDSFINCKIGRRFRGASQAKSKNGTAPIISNGIGSKVSVRIEHNKGLKKFNTLKDLATEIGNTLKKDLQLDESVSLSFRYEFDRFDERVLSNYAGADIFITVEIAPDFSRLRSDKGGSNLFQKSFNDIIKCITEGKAHEMHSPISDAEKISDLDIIPVGTLVRIKGSEKIIGCVREYNEADNTYGINKTEMTGTRILRSDENGDLYVSEYEDTGKDLGVFSRIKISPYNPENDAYYNNPSLQTQKQDKLSQEDLNSLNQPSMDGKAPQAPSMGNGTQPKVLNVGDIVWVRKAKKFGRIVSIDNGKFNVEEVVEKPCIVLDDSDNYL